MNEAEFKPVVGFENLYKISMKGEVFALSKHWKAGNGVIRHAGLRQLHPAINKSGYKRIVLCHDKKRVSSLIHRLVAFAFIPNPDPQRLVQVNHKDGNKLNNHVSNLEWCTNFENMRHSYDMGLRKPIDRTGMFNELHPNSRVTLQLREDGSLIKEWPSLKEIYRQLGFYPADICRVCLGKRPRAHGFRWKYKE